MNNYFEVGKTYQFIVNHYSPDGIQENDVYYHSLLQCELISSYIISVECIESHDVNIDGFSDMQTKGFTFKSDDGKIFHNQYPTAQYFHPKSIVQFTANEENSDIQWICTQKLLGKISSVKSNSLNECKILSSINLFNDNKIYPNGLKKAA